MKALTVAGVLALALTTGGCSAAAVPPAAASKQAVATSTVRQGIVTSSILVQGALGYGAAASISAAGGGTLTALPAAGSLVKVGEPLFSVDNVPVILLAGAVPAWHAFGAGMTAGPDVLQLLQNLKTLGFFAGTPGPAFTSAAATAVSKWQKALGLAATGSVPFGSIVFGLSSLRVDAHILALGATVGQGAAVLSTTAPDRVVTVPLPLNNQGAVKVGDRVSIQLPGGTATAGTVAAVLAPAKSDDSANATTIIPVTIVFDDATTAGVYTQGTVTVTFSIVSHDGVLSVPVEALLAIGNNEFGVKAVDTHGATTTIPVTIGLFGGGRVEISGSKIVDGLRVQVAS